MQPDELWFDANKCFINNQWVPPLSGGTLPLINPSNGEPLCEIAAGHGDDIDRAVQAAEAAMQGDWGRTTAAERGKLLYRLG